MKNIEFIFEIDCRDHTTGVPHHQRKTKKYIKVIWTVTCLEKTTGDFVKPIGSSISFGWAMRFWCRLEAQDEVAMSPGASCLCKSATLVMLVPAVSLRAEHFAYWGRSSVFSDTRRKWGGSGDNLGAVKVWRQLSPVSRRIVASGDIWDITGGYERRHVL